MAFVLKVRLARPSRSALTPAAAPRVVRVSNAAEMAVAVPVGCALAAKVAATLDYASFPRGVRRIASRRPAAVMVAVGPCGECPPGASCKFDGTCLGGQTCEPSCGTRECGDNGCGGLCGVCPDGWLCSVDGGCFDAAGCQPTCDGKACGPDGCGGWCGSCDAGQSCTLDGLCVNPYNCLPQCEGRSLRRRWMRWYLR